MDPNFEPLAADPNFEPLPEPTIAHNMEEDPNFEVIAPEEPDMSAMTEEIKRNLAAHRAEKAEKAANSTVKKPHDPDMNFFHEMTSAFGIGFDHSVWGLVQNGKAPTKMLPEDAPRAARIASQMGTLVGDVPAIAAGFIAGGFAGGVAGGAVGSAVPVAGTLVGAAAGAEIGSMAGANALPTAIRETLMQHYKKGDIKNFGDFWDRSSAIFLETAKSGTIGAVSGIAGVAGGRLASAAGAGITTKTLAATSSEIATMVTVGKALEGEAPNADDFIDAALLIGTIHGVGKGISYAPKAAGKIRDIYAKTGLKPEEVVEIAKNDPTVVQDILSDNIEIPKILESSIDEKTLKIDTHVNEVTGGGVKLPKDEVTEKINVERNPDEQAILDRVGKLTVEEPKFFDPKEAYRRYVDDLSPIDFAIKAVTDEKLKTVENPYELARLYRDHSAKAAAFFQHGSFDYKTLQKNGKGLDEILKPHAKDLDGFRAYAISKRALELADRGIETGMPYESAKKVAEDGQMKYQKTFDEMVDFQNRSLQYLSDSGILSKEQFAKIKELNKQYVDFSRVVDDGSGIGGKKGSNPIKAIKGSDRLILDPILSAYQNTALFVKLAEKNRAKVEFVKLMEKKEAGSEFIEKVPDRLKNIEVKADEIIKKLKEQGVDIDPDQVEAFSVFRSEKEALTKDQFEIYRDGKREVYETTPELSEAFKAFDGAPKVQNLAFKMATAAASLLRVGLTLSPDFIVRNLMRDQMTAGALSKYKAIPFVDSVAAIGNLIKKDEVYYNWLKSGGGKSTFLKVGDYVDSEIFSLAKETGLMDSAWNIVKKPIDFMKVTGELVENSTRLAEFKRVTGGGKDVSANVMMKGGFASREVTLDFARVGAKMRALNAITAFQNVQIQGLDRIGRAFKEDPKGMAVKCATLITLPSVALWWANKDDPRWREIPGWQKDLFWIVFTDKWEKASQEDALGMPEGMYRQNENGEYEVNNGSTYRIPKPSELGLLFGSVPERTLEQFFTDNPEAFTDFNKTMTDTFVPSVVPTIAVPVAEQFFNKSLFTGSAVVPSNMEKILPQYQYTEYTSESAKALGKMIAAVPGMRESDAASPMIVENYIRGWSGTTGMYALQLADQALIKSGAVPDPVKPASTLADIPFVKAFAVRYPSMQAQSIQTFFRDHKKFEKISNSLKALVDRGDIEAAEKFQESEGLTMALTQVKAALDTQSSTIQSIYQNKDWTPQEKRQMIDGIYYQMIETAKMGNEMMRDMKKLKEEMQQEMQDDNQ